MRFITPEQQREISSALDLIENFGLPFTAARERFAEVLREQNRRPTDDDQRWPRVEPPKITVHLGESESVRPCLGSDCQVGRMYTLSPGQRDYIRDQFGMTPAKLVEVTEVAVYLRYPDYIQRVSLVSCEHVNPTLRSRTMVAFKIDQWGKFMSEALANDQRRAEQAEVDKIVQRVDTFLKRCKGEGVTTKLTAFAIGSQVHAELMNHSGEVTSAVISNLLHQVLLTCGQHTLAAMVKLHDDVLTPKPKSKSVIDMDQLMNEYGVE